jgi:PPM family protein phosphatase
MSESAPLTNSENENMDHETVDQTAIESEQEEEVAHAAEQEALTPPDTAPLTMVREAEQPADEQGKTTLETRILTRKKMETAPLENARLQVAKICHVGAVRDRNEDACLVFDVQMGGHFQQLPFGLYIVADGMGGHLNGHEASNKAIRIAARQIVNRIYLPMLQEMGNPQQTPVQEVLRQAVEAANEAIYDPDPELDGGTTLTIALIIGRRLHVAHVGDSRAYLLRDGKLEAITEDHSLARRMQAVGQMSGDDQALYNVRHVLLRAVGQGEDLEIDTYTLRLPQHGRLLLCSDGLCGVISDAEIEQIMGQTESLTGTADALFQAAMTAGGYDNITTIVVDFSF